MFGVFEVVEVSPITEEQWRVRGRALRTITVGDTVFGARGKSYKIIHEQDSMSGVPLETEHSLELRPFVVIAVSTYGVEIDALDRGLTGDVVLQGREGEVLEETKLLIMPGFAA